MLAMLSVSQGRRVSSEIAEHGQLATTGSVTAMMADEFLQEKATIVAKQLMTDPFSKEIVTQTQAMVTDPYLQGEARMFAKLMDNAQTNAERAQAIDSFVNNPRFKEKATPLMKSVEAMKANPNFQDQTTRIGQLIEKFAASTNKDAPASLAQVSHVKVQDAADVSYNPPGLARKPMAASNPAASFNSNVAPSRATVSMATQNKITPRGGEYVKTMPGVTDPLGFFDPLDLSSETTVEQIRLWREAELTHGRVSMMAALGFLVQEAFHPIVPEISGPAARQLDLALSTKNGQLAGAVLLATIWIAEIFRARIGWVEPDNPLVWFTLRDGYLSGDIGFDPFNLKPKDEEKLLAMQNKELNNGRLAMLAIAGFVAQELATGAPIFGA